LEEKKHQYVVEWIYDEGVPLTKKADIELGIVVHKQIEDMDGETFTFAFSASKEELQKNTVHLKMLIFYILKVRGKTHGTYSNLIFQFFY